MRDAWRETLLPPGLETPVRGAQWQQQQQRPPQHQRERSLGVHCNHVPPRQRI